MDLGPKLATGNTAEIHALGHDRICKCFAGGFSTDAVRREAENTRAAAASGLPVPTVHEVTTVDGRPAIIFDRIAGAPMVEDLTARPWTLRRHARTLARLHARIHATRYPGGRSIRDRLRRDIERADGLTGEERANLLARLESLPEGDACCHGDFHPGNVLLAGDEPVVIDWLDAGRGHPAMDVARTNVLLRFTGEQAGVLLGGFVRFFQWWYGRAYRAATGLTADQIRAWELPVAAARLTEDVPEAPLLRAWVRRRLATDR